MVSTLPTAGVPRSTPGTRAGHTEVRVRGSRPWARVVAPDGAGGLVRCVAQALGLRRGAIWRSHPARAAAPAGDRRAAVGWPDHAAAASSPTPRITSSWSRRAPAWLRRGARLRRLPHGRDCGGPASAAVTVTWDTDERLGLPGLRSKLRAYRRLGALGHRVNYCRERVQIIWFCVRSAERPMMLTAAVRSIGGVGGPRPRWPKCA